MSNEEQEISMSDFLESYDVKRLERGQILEGTVIEVTDKDASVNINYAFDGLIAKNEISTDEKDPRDVLKAGDKVKVYVLSPNDGEGYVELSLIRAMEIQERENIKKAYKENEIITVKVKEAVKGGVVAYYGNIRVFIPGSLASRQRVELDTLVNKEMDIKITELDLKNNKIVGSRRVIEEAEYEKNVKAIWDKLVEGEKRQGVVKKLVKFGAFVDIGGVEGLIHLSDLSWKKVNKPEEVVKEGDKVEVFIGSVDKEKRRLSLVLKNVDEEPWHVHSKDIKEGDIVSGKVCRLTSFGAFVELFDGVEGLVHITEITDDNIAKASDVLNVGDEVKVKVLSFNKEDKKIALSIKDAVETNKEYMQYVDDSEEGTSLGDLLKGFKFEE